MEKFPLFGAPLCRGKNTGLKARNLGFIPSSASGPVGRTCAPSLALSLVSLTNQMEMLKN